MSVEEIRLLLDEDPERTWTLAQMRAKLGLSKTVCKEAASRAVARAKAVRVARGLYRSSLTLARPGLPHPDLRVHGLKLEGRYQTKGWSFLGMAQKVAAVWPSPASHVHPRNRSFTTNGEVLGGRWVTVTVHRLTPLVEVFLQSSDLPLTLYELGSFFEVVTTVLGLPGEFWTIRQSDWNIDAPGGDRLKVDLGLEGLSIAGYRKLMLKVYEKAYALVRTEVRTFDALPVEALMGFIRTILGTLEDARRGEQTP